MTFFYDLNKRLADLATKQDAKQLTESAVVAERADYSAKKAAAGKDIGKPGKMFSKIAKSAGKEYGSKAAGERVAGAVLNKLRAKESVQEGHCSACDCSPCECNSMEESALQAYIGDKKYGKKGMDALRKAGREGASKDKMSQIRNRYNKMDEADMEEGNEFSGELVKARASGAKEFKVDGKTYQVTSEKKEPRSKGTAFDKEYMDKVRKEKEAETHDRYDVKDTGYSKRYTRKAVDTDIDQDDEVKSTEPKKKGRPKGPAKGPERVTAKSYKYKAGRPTKTDEDLDTDGVMMNKASNMSSESVDPNDRGEYDREGDMAKEQMHTIVSAAKELHKILSDEENLPEWVQKKITLAKEYIDTARDYMLTQHAERAEEQPIAEKAVSVAQRRAAGIAHAAQKGEIPKKELRGASKEMARMPRGELKKFAKTKETGLPKKVKEASKPDFLDIDKDGNKAEPMKQAAKQAKGKSKEEAVDETTVAGSVATAPAKTGKGGYNFGGGVYESLDRQYRQALTEGMNVSVNMSTDANGQPSKNITVSAEGEDAEALAALLKMAGIGGHGDTESCGTCGKAPCGCEELDENSPDWPTNTEASDNAMQYSGGLNGPKSTGQTTVPVIASQLRRQVSMEESVKLESDLFRLYQNYKAQ
jgi:hypothetical protein